MKQLSDKMRDQRVQVADRVRKHVAAARILPKVVRTACPMPVCAHITSVTQLPTSCHLKSCCGI